MTKWYLIEFLTPVHVGERGIGVESTSTCIPSTTIHAAMINALIILGRITDKEALDAASSIKTSTPSPILSGETPLVWLQGLHVLFSRDQLKELTGKHRVYYEVYESLKKVRLVSEDFIYEDTSICSIKRVNEKKSGVVPVIECNGHEYTIIRTDDIHGNIVAPLKKAVEPIRFAEKIIRPKNTVDRVTGAAYTYNLGLIKYDAPLLMGISIDEGILSWSDIEASLRLLSDIGIGGERSYGFGRFRFKEAGIHIRIAGDRGSAFIVQGLYAPRPEKLGEILRRSIYRARMHGSRTGYMGIIRKPVIALAEGSIIVCEEGCEGITVVDSVYVFKTIRSFNPISIPFKGDVI